jgi:hypothetical protein
MKHVLILCLLLTTFSGFTQLIPEPSANPNDENKVNTEPAIEIDPGHPFDDWGLKFVGKITQTGMAGQACLMEDEPIAGVKILIKKDGMLLITLASDSVGEYKHEIQLENAMYSIRYKKDGFVTKWVTVDTRDVDLTDLKDKGFTLDTDISLFEKVEHIDLSFMETTPIGEAHFNPKTRKMDWDMDYTEKQMKRIEKTHKKSLSSKPVIAK